FIATLFLAGGLASVLVGPRAGALSDRLGRRPLILASCLGLTVVTAVLPFAVTEPWTAYVLYVVIMALFAMRMAPFQALLTGLVPGTERGAFLSFTIAVGQIGTALASVLSGALYARYGYAASTSLSAALMAVLAYLVWRHLPEPEAPEAGPAVA
ncbi:MAG TPA: MFS transporter, partial [Rubricoccaceae bacterium]